eukprot:scaffold55540_cov27-Tisochrysis_lutea.AAC.2
MRQAQLCNSTIFLPCRTQLRGHGMCLDEDCEKQESRKETTKRQSIYSRKWIGKEGKQAQAGIQLFLSKVTGTCCYWWVALFIR